MLILQFFKNRVFGNLIENKQADKYFKAKFIYKQIER